MTASGDELPIVDLRGIDDPAGRGEAYGAAASERIARCIDFYRWLLPAMLARPWEAIRNECTELVAAAADATPDALDLLRATAAAAGQEPRDLEVVACRSELMARAAIPTAECTAIRHRDGLAQTWDWFTVQREALVIVRTDRMATLTEAGMPAKAGANVDGLAITLNFLATAPPPTTPGAPIHLLIAELLEQASSVRSAIDRLLRSPIACSATIGLADPSGDAAFVELTPHRPPAVLDAATTPVHTNHCLAPELAGADRPGPLLDESIRRLARAQALVSDGLTPHVVLADRPDGGPSVDVSPVPGAPAQVALGTVAAVVIDVQQRTLAIAPSRPSVSGFVQRIAL